MTMRAYLVDDEPLALKRLERLLAESGRVEIAGSTTDPLEALDAIPRVRPDVLFLDIEMPELTGFELLARLPSQPLVVFTTAYDQYALRAFDVNSIDYLLKPVEPPKLERALGKLERIRGGLEPPPSIESLLKSLVTAYPARIASKLGDRVEFVELNRVTHFYAKDKLTYAAAGAKHFIVDYTIANLEAKLDPRQFVRIHRSTLVNVAWVRELHSWFGGKQVARLKDEKGTELQVSRDRVRELREKLGL